MKNRFTDKLKISEKNEEQLNIINSIIEEYAKDNYRLTLRQLYYQLVSRDIIPNEQKEYGKLSSLLVKGRMCGVVDWDAIEDRLRKPKIPYWVVDIPDALEDTIEQYRLDRQMYQHVYIEVWCEKDALSSILYRITSTYHMRLMVNRGYSSCTAMHDAYERLARKRYADCYILYLGDHDPSGLDMIRDVRDRLNEFGVFPSVIQLALTMEQIEKYNPPPNPARIKDTRAKWYIERYANISRTHLG